MANQVTNVNKINTGLCPHGLPPGACPICSNMGGTFRQSDRNRNLGEMTYHECVMIGNMLKARALAQKQHEANLEHRLANLKMFENSITKISARLTEVVQILSNKFITKPIAIVIRFTIIPVFNIIQNLPKLIQNIQNLKFEIQDKLNAIFGEAKAFVDKKIAELISFIGSKFKNVLKIFKKNNTEDDDTKIDDDKKIFNLKTVLHKIFGKKKEKDGECSKDK